MKRLQLIAVCASILFGALQSAAADIKPIFPFNEKLCTTFQGSWSPNTCTISTNSINRINFNIGIGESLFISKNTTFSNYGEINNAGTIANISGMSNLGANLINKGIINNSGTIASLNGGAISNLPSGKISNGGLIISNFGSFITNDGEIINSNTIDFNGTFTNRGDINNDNRSAVIRSNLAGVFINDWGGTVLNDGLLISYYKINNNGRILNNRLIGNNGQFNNKGKIYNEANIINRDNFSNLGIINNLGNLYNIGIFKNTGRFFGCINNPEPGIIYGVPSC